MADYTYVSTDKYLVRKKPLEIGPGKYFATREPFALRRATQNGAFAV